MPMNEPLRHATHLKKNLYVIKGCIPDELVDNNVVNHYFEVIVITKEELSKIKPPPGSVIIGEINSSSTHNTELAMRNLFNDEAPPACHQPSTPLKNLQDAIKAQVIDRPPTLHIFGLHPHQKDAFDVIKQQLADEAAARKKSEKKKKGKPSFEFIENKGTSMADLLQCYFDGIVKLDIANQDSEKRVAFDLETDHTPHELGNASGIMFFEASAKQRKRTKKFLKKMKGK